jgi:hypothetical protein
VRIEVHNHQAATEAFRDLLHYSPRAATTVPSRMAAGHECRCDMLPADLPSLLGAGERLHPLGDRRGQHSSIADS